MPINLNLKNDVLPLQIETLKVGKEEGRTHLMSPAMAAAAAINGKLSDSRDIMEKFKKIESNAIPLPMVNVDTDMIIPKQFLKTIKRTGLGKNLFYELRYDEKDATIDSVCP